MPGISARTMTWSPSVNSSTWSRSIPSKLRRSSGQNRGLGSPRTSGRTCHSSPTAAPPESSRPGRPSRSSSTSMSPLIGPSRAASWKRPRVGRGQGPHCSFLASPGKGPWTRGTGTETLIQEPMTSLRGSTSAKRTVRSGAWPCAGTVTAGACATAIAANVHGICVAGGLSGRAACSPGSASARRYQHDGDASLLENARTSQSGPA